MAGAAAGGAMAGGGAAAAGAAPYAGGAAGLAAGGGAADMGRDDCGMLGAVGACLATGRAAPVRLEGGIVSVLRMRRVFCFGLIIVLNEVSIQVDLLFRTI